MIVSGVPFQTADSNRFALQPTDALGFALRLLRANTSANSGKRVRSRKYMISTVRIAFAQFCNKTRNIDMYRATCHTRGVFTI